MFLVTHHLKVTKITSIIKNIGILQYERNIILPKSWILGGSILMKFNSPAVTMLTLCNQQYIMSVNNSSNLCKQTIWTCTMHNPISECVVDFKVILLHFLMRYSPIRKCLSNTIYGCSHIFACK